MNSGQRRARPRGSAGRPHAGSSALGSAASFSIIWLNSEYGSARGGLRRRRHRGPRARTPAPDALSISRSRIVSRTKSCTNEPCRKRTSVFDGCTFTSTSSAVAFEKQQRERVGRRRHQVVIRRGERVQQQAVANQPAVHEDEDRIAVALLHLRPRNEAAQAERARGRLVRLLLILGDGFGRRHAGRRSSSSFSRSPISTSSSSTWLPNTW